MKTAIGSKTFFFGDKPLFGLDIGHDELRVMQIDAKRKVPRLKGYGAVAFDPRAVADDVIVRPELIAKAAVRLFGRELIGDITTDRVAVSLPANRALTRAIQLPKMSPKDLTEAVQTEAEQYIPRIDELYLDYTVLHETVDTIEVFVVAMPKRIVDSYLTLTRMLGLEAVLFDTAIGASAHLFSHDKQSNIPSVLIDFGANRTDITIYNHGLVVTATADFGGDDLTAAIAKTVRVTPSEAIMLKSKYGLTPGVFQKQITAAIGPSLEQLLKEIRRTIRYYEQRYAKEPTIGQIISMGGGANMPGLTAYLTDQLHIPARVFDPAAHLDFSHLRSFAAVDHMSYVTAAGLAIADPKEIFA